jgi:hypothetical protein
MTRARTGAEWDAPRNQTVRFRVNEAEDEHVNTLAGKAGFGTVSDYLRSLLDLSAVTPGAPLGNKNKSGRKGANQHGRRGK